MRSAVVTVVAGRHLHLLAQRDALRQADPPPDVHVIVAMGDPEVETAVSAAGGDLATEVVLLAADPDALPLAAARNLGARTAVEYLGGDDALLVFLDVDCIPAPDLLARYGDAARRRGGNVLCGPVTYLPPRDAPWSTSELVAARSPHPARPDPEPGDLPDADPALFWSLSFALTASTWAKTGGFDESYTGYGAEDTDFARRAVERGVPIVWVGGADAYHQYHPTTTPPIQHTDAILRNGSHFRDRWGEWPMRGWLDGLVERRLLTRSQIDYRRPRPVRLATVPPRHPYVAAVRPVTGSVVVRPDRVDGWEPDPLLTADYLTRAAAEIDVVHLHFGFEQRTLAELEEWARAVDRLGIPVVTTVHDLRNPHLADNALHREQLRVLLGASTRVITLTDGAAADILADYGRVAEVLAHPTLIDDAVPPRPVESPRTVLVPLGPLRVNLVDPGPLVAAVADGARQAGGARVVVTVRPEVDDPRLRPVHALAHNGEVIVEATPRVSDGELLQRVAGAHVLVLPYRFGTHSGWLEMTRDLGTRAVVPSTGHYAQQEPSAVVYRCDEADGLHTQSLTAAVAQALTEDRPEPADPSSRRAERALIRARHEILYREVLAR